MRYIGDLHGDMTGLYNRALRGSTASVQVGDFGRGFLAPGIKELVDEFHTDHPSHKFIRGNHDDPADCRSAPGWIPDGTYDPVTETMYIGGAWSIDKEPSEKWRGRTAGRDWWPDEELSIPELERIRADFVYFKPKIVVTHDCPRSVAMHLFFRPPFDTRNHFRTRTSEALDVMLRDHQPDVWLFGHWHEDHRVQIGQTEFICLGIGSWVDL